MKFNNLANYLRKKFDALIVEEYVELIDGTAETIVEYTILTKDYKILHLVENVRTINKYLYGNEYVNWYNERQKEKAYEFNASNRFAMFNLVKNLEVEEAEIGRKIRFIKKLGNRDKANLSNNDINKLLANLEAEFLLPRVTCYNIVLIDIFDKEHGRFTCNKQFEYYNSKVEFSEALEQYNKMKEYYSLTKLFKKIFIKECLDNGDVKIIKEEYFTNVINKEIKSDNENILALIIYKS